MTAFDIYAIGVGVAMFLAPVPLWRRLRQVWIDENGKLTGEKNIAIWTLSIGTFVIAFAWPLVLVIFVLQLWFAFLFWGEKSRRS